MRLPRLTWHTKPSVPPPLAGEYMISVGPRARAAYLIHNVREVQPRKPRKVKVFSLSVERIGRDRIPLEANVHLIKFFKRERRRPGCGSG